MPVERVTINRPRADGTAWENIKAVYRCEVCSEPASFGFVVSIKHKRQRIWYCGAHRQQGIDLWKAQE